MKHLSRTFTTSFLKTLLVALALVLLTSGIVGAQPASNNRNGVAIMAETEDTEEVENEQESGVKKVDRQEVRDKVSQLRTEARTEIDEKRKTRETLSADQRIKVCENRKTAINNKLVAYTNAADKYLTKFDSVYVKILAFQKDKNVTVTNIDELTADADTKQKDAAEAIAALKEVAVELDCSDPDTAVTLGTVRDAAQTARKALHEYRISLKNIVVAIAQADKMGTPEEAPDTTAESTRIESEQEANE
jgi:hypothetical protein